MAEHQYDTAAHLAGLEERVSGLEKGMRDIASAVTGLASEIRSSQKTQWPIIWQAMAVALGILTVMGGLAYVPIAQEQNNIRNRIEAIGATNTTQRETDLYRRLSEAADDRRTKRLDRLEELAIQMMQAQQRRAAATN